MTRFEELQNKIRLLMADGVGHEGLRASQIAARIAAGRRDTLATLHVMLRADEVRLIPFSGQRSKWGRGAKLVEGVAL